MQLAFSQSFNSGKHTDRLGGGFSVEGSCLTEGILILMEWAGTEEGGEESALKMLKRHSKE